MPTYICTIWDKCGTIRNVAFTVIIPCFSEDIPVSPCPFVRPSVCVQSRDCFVCSTKLAWSVSHLHILSTNFKKCVMCWVLILNSEIRILASYDVKLLKNFSSNSGI